MPFPTERWKIIQHLFLCMKLGRSKPAKGFCSEKYCQERPVYVYLDQPGRWRNWPTARCHEHRLPAHFA